MLLIQQILQCRDGESEAGAGKVATGDVEKEERGEEREEMLSMSAEGPRRKKIREGKASMHILQIHWTSVEKLS